MGAVSRKGTRQGDFLAGKYLLEECLGVGGMGEVYRATNVSLGRAVAVKILSKEMTQQEDDVLRFLREARAAAAVRHANVVDVLDIMRDDEGTPFIVQELLSGQDLEQHVQLCGGRLTVGESLEVMIPVADAVSAAHAQKVVHRDLKPANIFLARDGSKVTPKVLDFGAALYQTVGGITAKEQRMLIGTPHYMAPEQITSKKDVDIRADVWAMGVILFEVLVGETPFEAETANAVMKKVRTVDIPRVRDLAKRVPQSLDDLVFRCLQRDKTKRFDDAAALRDALAKIRAERVAEKAAAGIPDVPERSELRQRKAAIPRDEPADPPSRPQIEPLSSPRVPSLALNAVKVPPKRRGSALLTLSSPDDELPPSDRSPAAAKAPPASTSRPIEAAKRAPALPRAAAPTPASVPKPFTLDSIPPQPPPRASSAPTEPPPPESIDAEAPPPPPLLQRGSSSSSDAIDPDLAALELDLPPPARISSDPASSPRPPSSPRPAPRPIAVPTPAVEMRPSLPRPRSSPSIHERAPAPSLGTAEHAKHIAAIVVPAFALFAVLRFVALPIGRAIRGDTPFAAGALAVVTLVGAAGIAAKALSVRAPAMVVAAVGAVVHGIVMIIVTFSASEAVELGIPPAASFLAPWVGPIAPLALALFFRQKSVDAWKSPYERREAYVFAAIACVLLVLGLLFSPFGSVRVH